MKNFLCGILWTWRSRFAKSEKQAMLTTLYRVKFSAFKTLGICGEFDRRCYGRFHKSENFRRLFRLWSKFSGHSTYPVPGGEAAFLLAASTERFVKNSSTL